MKEKSGRKEGKEEERVGKGLKKMSSEVFGLNDIHARLAKGAKWSRYVGI